MQLPRAEGVDPPFAGGEDVEMVVFPPACRQHGLHLFAGLQFDEVDQQHPASGAPDVVGGFVHIQRIDAAFVGEEQQLVVGAYHFQLHQGVVVPVAGAAHAFAAAPLVAVGADWHALDVAALAQGNYHVFLHDELFDGLFLHFGQLDGGAPGVGVLALHFAGFPLDFGADFLGVLQQVFQPGDGGQEVIVFFVQLLPFQGGQAAQLHIQDGLGLDFRQVELLHQVVAGGFHILAAPDGGDDGVNGVQGFEQALNDVGPVARPPQLVFGAAADDFLPVGDEVGNEVFEGQFLGLAVHQGQHYGVEG